MQRYEGYDDKYLLLLIKEKADHAAFTTIFDRYNALLYSHAYNKLRNSQEAEDIVQDVFSKLWIKRKEIDLNAQFPGFLFVFVRHQVIDVIRHRQVVLSADTNQISLLTNQPKPSDFLLREKHFNEMIEREIALLPPRMRKVFELRRNNSLSNREIALEMGITESTVSDQMKKALKILRLRLKWTSLFILVSIFINRQ